MQLDFLFGAFQTLPLPVCHLAQAQLHHEQAARLGHPGLQAGTPESAQGQGAEVPCKVRELRLDGS